METKGFLANMRGRKVGGELMTLGTDMPDPLSKLMLRLTDEVPLLSSAMLAHVERDSRELEALVRVPYPDGRRKIDEFVEKLDIEKMGLMRKHLNIWSSLLLPSEARVRHKQVQSEAMWAILRTAIDAQIKNPAEVRAQLAKLRDPYDGNPIAMRDVEGGVEITLKSNEGRTPVTITVGLGGK